MLNKSMEILHSLLTNQMVIVTVAVGLFLLVITLADPDAGEAVNGGLWI